MNVTVPKKEPCSCAHCTTVAYEHAAAVMVHPIARALTYQAGLVQEAMDVPAHAFRLTPDGMAFFRVAQE